MFLKQQQVIRKQKVAIRTFELQNDTNSHGDINNVVDAMIALRQQECSACMGSGTVLKQKKNIRYSVECKQCVH